MALQVRKSPAGEVRIFQLVLHAVGQGREQIWVLGEGIGQTEGIQESAVSLWKLCSVPCLHILPYKRAG